MLLRKWTQPPPPIMPLSEFSKTIVLYALHTHIFDWRSAVSMLNPTGLKETPGGQSVQAGQGLKGRRAWLVDAFDSFYECYISPSPRASSYASTLLTHYGYIALDVSISDMHLMAGRSLAEQDGSFAEENLKYWANSDIADTTMRHIVKMLAICHEVVESGRMGECSYEVTICLFTGGMVCWAFAKLRFWDEMGRKVTLPTAIGRGGAAVGGREMGGPPPGMLAGPGPGGKFKAEGTATAETGLNEGWGRYEYVEQVRRASEGLSAMGGWRMGDMFGKILKGMVEGKGGKR